MAGKRVKKRRRSGPKLLGAAVALAAAGVLLLAGEPQGAAVNSPLEEPAPKELAREAVAQLPAEERTWAPVEAERDGMSAAPKASREVPQTEAPDPRPIRTEESAATPEAPLESPAAEEPQAVPDTYFDDAVFLGDSRTEGFHLYSGLKTGKYLYATGATVSSVFTKAVETPQGRMPLLDALQRTDCGMIYVMLGVNELGWNGTDTFRNQTAKLIERIQADHPDAVLVLQSILPVSSRQDAKGSYVNNRRIDAYNQVLQELAAEYGVTYLHVAEAVADESGCLRADWNFDGVHLNVAGCQAWLEYLRTHPVTEAAVPEPAPEAGSGTV